MEAHLNYLHSLPCYTLYQKYNVSVPAKFRSTREARPGKIHALPSAIRPYARSINRCSDVSSKRARSLALCLVCMLMSVSGQGSPPLQPAQVQLIHSQIAHAQQILQQGVDQDWRTSCLQYPQVLDYYFNLVDISLPSERDPSIQAPTFGGNRPKEARRVKDSSRNDSFEVRSRSRERHQGRRRNRTGRTPPPAPMPGPYRR